jgi:hypothetical protein
MLAAGCLIWLAACDKTTQQAVLSDGSIAAPGPATTVSNATLVSTGPLAASDPSLPLLGNDQHDDLNLGKKQFRARNYGLAERYFRRAV